MFTGPSYYPEDLAENYNEKEKEIKDLINFTNKNTPKGTKIHIELEGNELTIFHINNDSIKSSNWNIDINSKKADSLLNIIGWTNKKLEKLEIKLEEANCISISNGNPCNIGWQRSGMGMYMYNLFEENLNDSLINSYNDSCSYIFYKENIVFQYGGGAFGPQCFPNL